MGWRDHDIDFDFPIVSQDNRELLNEIGPLALEEYRAEKADLLTWLAVEGKKPFRGEGYAMETIRKSHYKIEKTYRWYWREHEHYSWRIEPDDATEYIDYLVKYSDLADPQVKEYAKAIKLLFSYFNEVYSADIDWEHDRELDGEYKSERDHFRQRELRALFDAALSYGSMPSYNGKNLSPAERDRLKQLLSQRLGEPKENIGPEEFREANSWKIPSLIGVTNDAGLRPKEVGTAKVGWIDPDNQLLRIPPEDAIKAEKEWKCGLSSQTCRALERWLEERRQYEQYDDTDYLWLNERGSQYNYNSLNHLLDKLMEEAGIEQDYRDLTWYSIRHGVATLWANKNGVHYAKEQLRHKKAETTMDYLHSDAETQSEYADEKW